jgi:glycosyltransferase involved in cell wall biosynthesis
MKVLMQNRSDCFENWSGDTTQMIETKKELESMGVNVDISLAETPNLKGYDLVHIFQIQNPSRGLKQLMNAKNCDKPVVLSTIYWDYSYGNNTKENYLYSDIPLVRMTAKINLNIPHILAKLAYLRKRMKERKLMKFILNKADIILPNSYLELEIIENLFKIPQLNEKSFIVPNGVSKLILKHKLTENEYYEYPKNCVLEVGKVSTWKGQLKLIASLMNFPDIPLVFVGLGLNSIYGKKCVKMGEERGNTYFAGGVPHDKVYSFYENAKVHALPSLGESAGVSTLEAGIFGTNCVVSTQAGSVTEYFGSDVFYCEAREIDSIQEAVLKAWDSPKNNKLKNKILNNYTWDKAAEVTLKAYNHILKIHNS